MHEEKTLYCAKFRLYNEIEKEVKRIEGLINSGKLSIDEKMALSDKVMQYKGEYVYLDELERGESEDEIW